MDDVIVIDDYVDDQCVRHVHVMSNAQIDCAVQMQYAPAGSGCVTREIGAYHFRAEYPYRGAHDIACVGSKKRFRRLVLWSLEDCASVTQALHDARAEYCRLFGGEPKFGFMSRLPKGIENGHEYEEMSLFEAEWMLEKCVAVGGKQ